MAALKNQRHELFALGIAKGKTAEQAFADAGYSPNPKNTTRLKKNEGVAARIAELKERAAVRVVVTVESLASELEEARLIAITNKQTSAAVQATMGKAKLFGLGMETHRHTGPNGGPIQHIDLSKATEEQLAALEALILPAAVAAGAASGGDPGGEGEAGGGG
jgi:hypothetical protein